MVLFTQPGCGQCKMIHTLMDKKKIKYEESQDLDKLKAVGGDHTPSLLVDGKILVGQELFKFINEH